MTLTRSLPTQHASGLPLIDERRLTMGRYVRNTDGTARVGVLPTHTNPLVSGRSTAPTMAYDIAAFHAVTARTTAGAEEIANDATVTVATTAAPGANSRIDVIWVRSQFVFLGDANNDVVFGVTQGAAAVSPTKPGIPAGALELATATIPSTATTTLSSGVVITQTYLYTAPVGGLVWLRNQTEQDAWAPSPGVLALRLDTGAILRRTGSAWVASVEDTGWIVPTLTGGYTNFGSGYAVTRYRRINGVVHIEGTVAAGNVGQVIFSLPPGFRPALEKLFITSANAGIADVRVRPSDGAVYAPGYYAGGSGALIALNISFPADA